MARKNEREIFSKFREMNTITAVKLGLFRNKKDGMSDFMAVLIIILIAVIVGAALLAIMRTAMPDLFQDIIDKIKTTFEV